MSSSAGGIGKRHRQRHARHVADDVDAIQQRAGDAAAVARNRVGRAMAAAIAVAGVAAGAGVHRRDQLEARRELRLVRGARNHDAAGLHGFAQYFQHAAVEFGQLVEEQHTVVRQRNFAGTRMRAAVICCKKCDNKHATLRLSCVYYYK